MLVFISCAKTMAARCSVVVPEVTVPKFETEAVRNALEMSQYSVSELERLLRVNTKIAAENRLRFHDFCSEENRSMPAVCAYTGAVFKRILPKDFSAEDFSLCARTSTYHFFSLWVASPAGTVSNPIVWKEMSVARKRWNIHV